MGFDRSVVFDHELDTLGELDDQQFISLYSKGAHQVGEKFVQAICKPEAFDLGTWQARLNAGEFHPKRLVPEFFETKIIPANAIVWKASDIPSSPHMEPEGIALLEVRLRGALVYLEYGAGGSTVLAADLGVKNIHSVESDKGFLSAVQSRVAERQPAAKMTPHHVDIGPTKEWGQPTDRASANHWPQYCFAVWNELTSQNIHPDLILIDGRFRVASFLSSLIFAKPGTVILFDDYFDRPHYHVVEKYVRPGVQAGRLAEFIVESSFTITQLLFDLMTSSTDPA